MSCMRVTKRRKKQGHTFISVPLEQVRLQRWAPRLVLQAKLWKFLWWECNLIQKHLDGRIVWRKPRLMSKNWLLLDFACTQNLMLRHIAP